MKIHIKIRTLVNSTRANTNMIAMNPDLGKFLYSIQTFWDWDENLSSS